MLLEIANYFVLAPIRSIMRMDQLNVRMEEFDLPGLVEEIWLIRDAVAADLVLKEYADFLVDTEVEMLFDVIFQSEAPSE